MSHLYSIFLLFLFSLIPTVSFAGDIAQAWEGKITYIFERKGNSSGSMVEVGSDKQTWNLNVRYKEGPRVDIKDRKGRLTGQFVQLVEEGSTWVMTGGGEFTRTRGCSVSHEIRSYKGEGTKTLNYGWVYYSLSDKDPLAGVLPNGSYHLTADQGQWGDGVVDITSTSCSGSSHSSQIPTKSILSFRISRPNLIPNYNPPQGYMVAEDLKPYVAGIVTPGVDVVIRHLNSDGRMKDSYSHSGFIGTHLTHSATWDLEKVLDIKCTIEEVDKNWRPYGGVYGNTKLLKAYASLDESQDLEGKFRFKLTEVSTEKGYAMNAGDEEDFDLTFSEFQENFEAPEETSDGWKIEGTKTDERSDVWIKPLDYGAWGKLKVDVNVDGKWYACKSEDGKDHVTVPQDKDGDHIADWWEEYNKVKDEDENADNDSKPIGREDGDGFTNYEEYRGFKVASVWQTTDPNKKDLFVHAESGLSAYTYKFQEASGLDVHASLRADEYDENRVVNFNRGHGTIGEQKGLYLLYGSLGTANGKVSRVGTPSVCDTVKIDFSIADFTASTLPETVAHELGHGVNLMHHGNYSEEGTCGTRPAHGSSVAMWGGQASGDTPCLMRYDNSVYAFYKGRDGQCYEYPEGDDVEVYFCDSKTGTGINAGPNRVENELVFPVTGDAGEFGDCKHNITLKGKHYDGN
jgi:hypothetical protein